MCCNERLQKWAGETYQRLDVSLDTLRMWDAFVIFYYAFLGNEDRATYKDIVNGILEKCGVQEAGWTHIKEL